MPAAAAHTAAMVLLDTHLLLWAALQPERLPAAAMKLLRSRDSAVAYSLASLWEVAIKTSLGRPEFNVDAAMLRRWLASEGFTELPIKAEHILQATHLAWHHRDPFDRLLVAQAQVEAIKLWSVDSALRPYGRAVKVLG